MTAAFSLAAGASVCPGAQIRPADGVKTGVIAVLLNRRQHVKGLASKILARSARQLPQDWQRHYGHRPLLLETLVDAERFRGTCYRAANWIHVGQTTGRGRMDREHKAHAQAIKDIYLYPLLPDARQRLRGDFTR